MLKLIKMDFYRLFSSKTIGVGAFIACLVSIGYMLISCGIVSLVNYAVQTDPAASMGISLFLSQASWIEGVNFSEIVFSGTGVFSLFIGCMITANFIGSEQSCGYTKNFAGQLPNKGYMAISKFVVTSIAQIMVLAIYTIASSVLAMLLFGQYINGYDINTLLAALGLRLMLYLAINSIIIFVCTLTKSHAIAMVVGCIFGIGVTKFVYLAADVILGALKINFSIGNLVPDGISSQLAIDTVESLAVKAIAVSVVFIVGFLMANYIIVRKRDVR